MSTLSQFFGRGGDKLVPVEIFAVGGGGGGAGGFSSPGAGGGGGGAGLVIYDNKYFVVGKTYNISIGAGGASGGVGGNAGNNGSSTTIDGIGLSAYGGGGAFQPYANANYIGSSGLILTSGLDLATSPTTFVRQYNLGNVTYAFASDYAILTSAPNTTPRSGGGAFSMSPGNTVLVPSFPYPIQVSRASRGGGGIDGRLIGYGSATFAGGGGSGGTVTPPSAVYLGGFGSDGGGNGGDAAYTRFTPPTTRFSTPGTNASANTGGGGGGGGAGSGPGTQGSPGGSGGSGVLFIRYPTAFTAATVTGNAPTPAQSGYHVYRWNSGPGTISFN
jgi:hypothetical protein